MMVLDASMVGLDANAVTFLIEAMSPSMIVSASSLLDEQRLALLRSFIYQKEIFRLLPTVEREYRKIKDSHRRKMHDLLGVVHMMDVLSIEKIAVDNLKEKFQKYHSGETDCKVLAEAEVGGLGGLVTFDQDFQKHLQSKTRVIIMSPKQYWEELNVPKGAATHREPHPPNPMSKSSHWKWK